MLDPVIGLFDKGGVVMIPIALFCLGGFALIVDRALFYSRILKETREFETWLAGGGKGHGPEFLGNPVVKVLAAGLDNIHLPREEVEAIMRETALDELPKMERHLSTIAIIGATLPMLGLLGTIVGMIATFEVISAQGVGDPRLLSGGISQALITTESGLVAAIPFMFLHNWLQNRYHRLIGLLEKETSRVLSRVNGGREPEGQ